MFFFFGSVDFSSYFLCNSFYGTCSQQNICIKYQTVDQSKVYLAPYDAKQIRYIQYSNRGEKLDLAADPYLTLYNEYFGGGMNAIVFQEMREARGLAYSSSARLYMPSFKDDSYLYYAFIATQNDKMKTAIEAYAD